MAVWWEKKESWSSSTIQFLEHFLQMRKMFSMRRGRKQRQKSSYIFSFQVEQRSRQLVFCLRGGRERMGKCCSSQCPCSSISQRYSQISRSQLPPSVLSNLTRQATSSALIISSGLLSLVHFFWLIRSLQYRISLTVCSSSGVAILQLMSLALYPQKYSPEGCRVSSTFFLRMSWIMKNVSSSTSAPIPISFFVPISVNLWVMSLYLRLASKGTQALQIDSFRTVMGRHLRWISDPKRWLELFLARCWQRGEVYLASPLLQCLGRMNLQSVAGFPKIRLVLPLLVSSILKFFSGLMYSSRQSSLVSSLLGSSMQYSDASELIWSCWLMSVHLMSQSFSGKPYSRQRRTSSLLEYSFSESLKFLEMIFSLRFSSMRMSSRMVLGLTPRIEHHSRSFSLHFSWLNSSRKVSTSSAPSSVSQIRVKASVLAGLSPLESNFLRLKRRFSLAFSQNSSRQWEKRFSLSMQSLQQPRSQPMRECMNSSMLYLRSSWRKNCLVSMSTQAMLMILRGCLIFRPIRIILEMRNSQGISTMNLPMSDRKSWSALRMLLACSVSPISASSWMRISRARLMSWMSGGLMVAMRKQQGFLRMSFLLMRSSCFTRRMTISSDTHWISGFQYWESFSQSYLVTSRQTMPSETLPTLPERWIRLA